MTIFCIKPTWGRDELKKQIEKIRALARINSHFRGHTVTDLAAIFACEILKRALLFLRFRKLSLPQVSVDFDLCHIALLKMRIYSYAHPK